MGGVASERRRYFRWRRSELWRHPHHAQQHHLGQCSTIPSIADGNGGGVANSGTLTMTNSTISGNSAYLRRRCGELRHPHRDQ